MTTANATRPPLLPIAPGDDLGDYTESFLSRYDGLTQNSYREDMRIYLSWCQMKNLDVFNDITRVQLETYLRWLRDERHSKPASVRRRLSTVRQFYALALDDDLVRKNPTSRVITPKLYIDQSTKVSITREEMTRLLETAHDTDPSEYLMCALMAYCGLRIGEVCALNVSDVNGTMNGQRVLRFTAKGGYAEAVPVPDVVARALDAVAEGRDGAEPLILRRGGDRMERRTADRIVKRIARKAGVTSVKVSPHTLRHSSIVSAIDAGVPIREVQLSARHRDISTTIKLYDRGRGSLENHSAHTLVEYFGQVD